jgi:D-beta-D-heptose 7-phosphate kinase/D-beta-D-heptose 1-phosphate adenosyltransferase
MLKSLRDAGQSIVFTNGVFDLPHPGHVSSLRAAKTLGDVLVVGINTDASVRRGKGHDRPIIPESERAKILASFEMVDFVTLFDEDTPIEVVKTIQPDVIAKGADYRNREVVGADVVMARGGRVEFLPMEDGISSTTIIDRIMRAHQ